MKCLSIGARSNDDKTQFWGWQKTSKLEGLATSMDFPSLGEAAGGSIIMSCKSVEVEETDDDLIFVGEPKMAIQNQTSPTYSNYITTHYDSVAYYDEPLFLKMKELIKLILAMEWLKDHGIKFNREWITEHTQRNPSSSSKAIEIVDATMTENLLKKFTDTLKSLAIPINETQQIPTHAGPVNISMKMLKLEKGLAIEMTKSDQTEESLSIKVSANDYDMLYNNIDPKIPFGNSAGKPISPDVQTWSELFAETVPWPMVWLVPPEDKGNEVLVSSGGVSTDRIPVTKKEPTSTSVKVPSKEPKKESQYIVEGDKVGVKASKVKSSNDSVHALPTRYIPTAKSYNNPKKDVECKTVHSQVNKLKRDMGEQAAYGWEDNSQIHMSSKDGQDIVKGQKGLHTSIKAESSSASTKAGKKVSDIGAQPSLQPQAHQPSNQLPMQQSGTSTAGNPNDDQNSPSLNIPPQPVANTPASPTSTDSGLFDALSQASTCTSNPLGDQNSQPLPPLSILQPAATAGSPDLLSPTSTDSGFASGIMSPTSNESPSHSDDDDDDMDDEKGSDTEVEGD